MELKPTRMSRINKVGYNITLEINMSLDGWLLLGWE